MLAASPVGFRAVAQFVAFASQVFKNDRLLAFQDFGHLSGHFPYFPLCSFAEPQLQEFIQGLEIAADDEAGGAAQRGALI